jgi:hypothetical protein
MRAYPRREVANNWLIHPEIDVCPGGVPVAFGARPLPDDEVVLLDAFASTPMRLHPSRRVRVQENRWPT